MTVQYDVKGSHSSGTGLLVSGRVRLKNLVYQGNGTAGSIDIFDTTTAPVSATYARSGTTVTVTSTAHGLTTGQNIGITYAAASGVSATAGNYVVTVTGANTFTITDINSGTIAASTACVYSTGKWVTSYNTGTAVQPFQVIFSGEGILVQTGVYVVVTNISYQTVQYG
jgi:hypothetical protein